MAFVVGPALQVQVGSRLLGVLDDGFQRRCFSVGEVAETTVNENAKLRDLT